MLLQEGLYLRKSTTTHLVRISYLVKISGVYKNKIVQINTMKTLHLLIKEFYEYINESLYIYFMHKLNVYKQYSSSSKCSRK